MLEDDVDLSRPTKVRAQLAVLPRACWRGDTTSNECTRLTRARMHTHTHAPTHAQATGGITDKELQLIMGRNMDELAAMSKTGCLLYTSPSPRDRG